MSSENPHETLFKNVLFCTNFSENADYAFDYVLSLMKNWPESKLHILHVIPEPDAQFWKTYLYEIEDVDKKAKSDIAEKIHESYLSRAPEGMDVEVVIRIGKDYYEILEYSKEAEIDLVVMGRQGSSRWDSVLYSHVTEKLARHAECAVMIIPHSFVK